VALANLCRCASFIYPIDLKFVRVIGVHVYIDQNPRPFRLENCTVSEWARSILDVALEV
jgi:hypothetical protein